MLHVGNLNTKNTKMVHGLCGQDDQLASSSLLAWFYRQTWTLSIPASSAYIYVLSIVCNIVSMEAFMAPVLKGNTHDVLK